MRDDIGGLSYTTRGVGGKSSKSRELSIDWGRDGEDILTCVTGQGENQRLQAQNVLNVF